MKKKTIASIKGMGSAAEMGEKREEEKEESSIAAPSISMKLFGRAAPSFARPNNPHPPASPLLGSAAPSFARPDTPNIPASSPLGSAAPSFARPNTPHLPASFCPSLPSTSSPSPTHLRRMAIENKDTLPSTPLRPSPSPTSPLSSTLPSLPPPPSSFRFRPRVMEEKTALGVMKTFENIDLAMDRSTDGIMSMQCEEKKEEDDKGGRERRSKITGPTTLDGLHAYGVREEEEQLLQEDCGVAEMCDLMARVHEGEKRRRLLARATNGKNGGRELLELMRKRSLAPVKISEWAQEAPNLPLDYEDSITDCAKEACDALPEGIVTMKDGSFVRGPALEPYSRLVGIIDAHERASVHFPSLLE